MPETLEAPVLQRRKFSVADFHRMGEHGILDEDERVELIEGELISMSPIGTRHMTAVIALTRALQPMLGETALLSVQNPIRLGSRSEPQPDLALLRPPLDPYRTRLPGPEDILLLIEVADSSADYDREVKMPLYARHSISEVWLVDLALGAVEVYRAPQAGRYGTVTRHGPDDTLVPESLPGLSLALADLLL